MALVLFSCAQPARSWVTVDGGTNITLHATTNIGSATGSEKYDLTVYGDTNVGGVNKITTSTTDSLYNLYVEGSITALQVIFSDSQLAADGTTDFVFMNVSQDTGSSDSAATTVSFNRYYKTADDAEPTTSDLMLVSVGTNTGDVDITVAGNNAQLLVKANYGYQSSITLIESAEDDPDEINTQFTISNYDGNGRMAGQVGYPVFALTDNRTEMSMTSAGDADLMSFFENTPLAEVGVSSAGSASLNISAADLRSYYGQDSASFLDSVVGGANPVRAMLGLEISSSTELIIAAETNEFYDQIVFYNGTTALMTFNQYDLVFSPNEGVTIGAVESSSKGAADVVYRGSEFSVCEMNIVHYNEATSPYINDVAYEPVAVMEINSLGDSTYQGELYDTPLFLKSFSYVRAHAPYFVVGDGEPESADTIADDPFGTALKFNSTGVTQTTTDELLELYSMHGNQLGAGVSVKGAYKVIVNNITMHDLTDTIYDDASLSGRYVTSETGTLRISALEGDNGDLYNFGPEVYIDGGVDHWSGDTTKVRLRVGNAIFADGFDEEQTSKRKRRQLLQDYSSSTEDTDLYSSGITLIGVGTASSSTWAPTSTDAIDAVSAVHTGHLVLRSDSEVRVDNDASFRVGDPYICDQDIDAYGYEYSTGECVRPETLMNGGVASTSRASISLDSTQQKVYADSEQRPLVMQNALGIEIGSLDGGATSGGRASLMDRYIGSEYTEEMTDDAMTFQYGRPLLLVRDLEMDGCSLPCQTSDASCYTADYFDTESAALTSPGMPPASRIRQIV